MKPVKSIDKVIWLAERKKSIYHRPLGKKLPAMFLANFQAMALHILIKGESLWYE